MRMNQVDNVQLQNGNSYDERITISRESNKKINRNMNIEFEEEDISVQNRKYGESKERR